ncbi:hypothetical protein [Myroides pelagicus]|uniref:META domain-containing protein n=1 Tax=Myroides pelagicus TaxID=270914 RepID=A0A7K1GPI3_9FLAO|nr:hypothetical protein [Myroides pelagicus]MEC4113851.1 hypothetical protein [Myroides pelagicus]MTH30650.1 hypothetical protein [Myroides pelagicus]
MKSQLLLLSFLSLTFSLAKAQTNGKGEKIDRQAITNTNWKLYSLNDINLPSNHQYSINLNLIDLEISGNNKCHSFIIPVKMLKLVDNKLTLKTTKIKQENDEILSCLDNEIEVIHLLSQTKLTVTIIKDTLNLVTKKNKVIKLTKETNNPLQKYITRYHWKLIQYKSDSDTVFPILVDFNFKTNTLYAYSLDYTLLFHVNFTINYLKGNIQFNEVYFTNKGYPSDNFSQTIGDSLHLQNYSFDVAEQTFNIYYNNKIIMMFGITDKPNQ